MTAPILIIAGFLCASSTVSLETCAYRRSMMLIPPLMTEAEANQSCIMGKFMLYAHAEKFGQQWRMLSCMIENID